MAAPGSHAARPPHPPDAPLGHPGGPHPHHHPSAPYAHRPRFAFRTPHSALQDSVMTRRFGGFLTSEEPSLQIPRVFVAEVLPQIADFAELKVTLCLFDLLAEAGGYDAPLAEETVYRHAALRASLKRLGSPKEPDESIGRGLELAVSRGTVLRFMATPAEGANGRGQSWYLLNTPRNREALGKMARGVAPPLPALHEPDAPPPLIEPERPNVFRLYEQNVGLLTPIIADQLIEATERYPRS